MEIKELIELFATKFDIMLDLELVFFRDGSGFIKTFEGDEILSFDSTYELIVKLQGRREPSTDCKSLFSVVDDELHPDLQEFLKSLMEVEK